MNTDLVNTYNALLQYGNDSIARMKKVVDDTDFKNTIGPPLMKISSNGNFELTIPWEPYGHWIDVGRKPWGQGPKVPSQVMYRAPHNTYPPEAAIEKWIRKKGIKQFRVQKTWKSAGKKGGRWISHKSRLFLIRRAIAVHGIKPRPFSHIPAKNINDLLNLLGPAAALDYAINLTKGFSKAGIEATYTA